MNIKHHNRNSVLWFQCFWNYSGGASNISILSIYPFVYILVPMGRFDPLLLRWFCFVVWNIKRLSRLHILLLPEDKAKLITIIYTVFSRMSFFVCSLYRVVHISKKNLAIDFIFIKGGFLKWFIFYNSISSLFLLLVKIGQLMITHYCSCW